MKRYQTSNRTFGVEFEVIRRYGVTLDEIKEKIRTAGFKVTSDSYCHTGNRHNYWTIKPDGSLSQGGFEIVSPILSGQAGLDAVGKMADLLETVAKVDSTCGFHVRFPDPGGN